MKKDYQLIIFDVDGTLLDTSEGLLASAAYAIEAMGFAVPQTEILKSFIGPPMQDSFEKTFALHGQRLADMTALFRQHYKDKDLLKAVLYPGIMELLSRLHECGFVMAAATYKRQDYAETIVRHFGLERYMEVICGSDFAGEWRKKDIIQHALEQAGSFTSSQAVMVGDTVNDAIGAENLNMDFLAVTYGFGYKEKAQARGRTTIGTAMAPRDIIRILQEVRNED